jgi:hypothetical protein
MVLIQRLVVLLHCLSRYDHVDLLDVRRGHISGDHGVSRDIRLRISTRSLRILTGVDIIPHFQYTKLDN